MGRINWQRLFLGGLFAGFVDNLLQFVVNRLYLFRLSDSAIGMRGMAKTERTDNHFPLFMMILVGGIFCVWLYAMIRPRFGSGPMTATLAGCVYWLLSWLFPNVLNRLSGLSPAIPMWLLATHLITHLGVTVAATIVGSWFYREFDAQEARVLQEV